MSNSRNHYIPEETEALRKWHNNLAEKFLSKIGIKEGSYVVDFGCGAGNYVLPAGKIVGEMGRIYAIDNEQLVIDEINKKTQQQNLTNQIKTIKTKGEFSFPIDDYSIDFILIFDVLGAIANYKGIEGIKKLVEELHRIAKKEGKIVLALKHLSNWREPKETVLECFQKYFHLEKEEEMMHLHWDFLENNTITILSRKIIKS